MNPLKAIINSKGPRSRKELVKLYLKGLAMGAADIVPGVSGGTIAFITGIYRDLIEAIRSFDLEFLKVLLKLKISEAITRTSFKFLLVLLLGIISAIISMAHLIIFLLEYYPENLWSFFFGLILASAFYINKRISNPDIQTYIFLIIGALMSYFIVGMVPLETPESWWFILLSGALAICAMILPGISGAFVLLLLGKYSFMISALKNPFDLANAIVIIIFITGCIIGIVSFSRLVSYVYVKYYNFTIAFLLGFVLGSLRKVWPWKELIEQKNVVHANYALVEVNVLPDPNISLLTQLFLMMLGFSLVYFLEKIGKGNDDLGF